MDNIKKRVDQIYFDRKKNAQIAADNYTIFCYQYDDFKKAHNEYNTAKIKYYISKKETDKNTLNQQYEQLCKIAKKHKIDMNKLTPQYICSHCNDSGIINGKHCDCYEKMYNQLKSNTFSSNINKTHTFESSTHKALAINDIDKIYRTAKSWCEKCGESAIINVNLTGTAGLGKTYLLECIANHFYSQSKTVLFTTAFALNHQCRLYHCNESSLLDEYLSADILIIDDLGTEPILKNVTIEYLYNIYNERLNKKLPTLMSTNLNLPQLLDKYGSRIFSRMAGKGNSLNILFEGTDNRLKI